jgi:hypothetical protein
LIEPLLEDAILGVDNSEQFHCQTSNQDDGSRDIEGNFTYLVKCLYQGRLSIDMYGKSMVLSLSLAIGF